MTSEFGPGLGPDPEPDDRQPFGVNSAQVWIFLEELREFDLDRAILVWDGYGIAQSNGYSTALGAAEHVAEKHRPAAWSRARQAAAMVARKRLGDLTLTGEIIAVLADVAGSLVVRDMLSGRDFKLLQLPWTWHGEHEPALAADGMGFGLGTAAAAAAAVVVQPVATSTAVPVTVGQPAGRALPTFLTSKSVRFGARALTVIATVTVLASLTRLTPDSGSVDSTDGPGDSSVAIFVPGSSPTAPTGAETGPASTGAPSVPPPTAAPQPPATRAPAPTPPPQPTPRPTPTPKPVCTVISLLDVPTVKAQEKWSAAGFTGKITFSPAVPPQYRIQWQSLAAGASVTCSHAITVSDHAP